MPPDLQLLADLHFRLGALLHYPDSKRPRWREQLTDTCRAIGKQVECDEDAVRELLTGVPFN